MLESPPPHPRLYVVTPNEGEFKMPMTCRHCDPAPCIAACIPQAMHRSADDTVTNVGGKHECIACSMCIMMCPFGMIGRGRTPDGKVMALKCDLCPDRDVPACAASCPTGAITYVEGDQFAQQSRLRASEVFATARQIREVTLVKAQEE